MGFEELSNKDIRDGCRGRVDELKATRSGKGDFAHSDTILKLVTASERLYNCERMGDVAKIDEARNGCRTALANS